MEWSEVNVEGCSRFLHRVFRLVEKHAGELRPVKSSRLSKHSPQTEKEKTLLRRAHQTLQRISHDLESRWHFNTSVAALMELANELQRQEPLEENADPGVIKEVLELFILMLAPMTPHLAEELWEMLGHSGGLWKAAWPHFDAEMAREELHEVVVQINGKVRGKIVVEGGLAEEEVVARALAEPKVAAHLDGKQVRKRIVVPNKLVNLVVT
jgi:leucyl-tRNA synthetase